MSWKKTVKSAALSLLLAVGIPAASAVACGTGVQSCSSGYQVNEVYFGAGGNLNACSTGPTGYCAKESAGETAVGNPKSTTYQAHAGFNTDRNPSLQFLVNTTSIDLGVLNTSSTATATASFQVKTYLASGYSVQTMSVGPKNGSYTMTSPSSPVVAAPGTEQFGINVVKNTSCGVTGIPNPLGNDPAQMPSSTFSFGGAATNYNQNCKFMYHNGDTIASSSQSSGETDYTMSYIFNISPTTPGGVYTMNQVLVATSTF